MEGEYEEGREGKKESKRDGGRIRGVGHGGREGGKEEGSEGGGIRGVEGRGQRPFAPSLSSM